MNKFDDITPPEKRSIRNIPLPVRADRNAGHPSMDGIRPGQRTVHNAPQGDIRPLKKESAAKAIPPEKTPLRPVKTEKRPAVKRMSQETTDDSRYDGSYEDRAGSTKRGRWKFWSVAVVVILLAGYFLSTYFAHADIDLSLAKHDVVLRDKEIPLTDIHYTVVAADISKSATVQANGFQKVSRYAKGTVVLYNSADTTPQNLSVNTRLETSDGLIFKTDSAVTIPAITKSGGKTIAGSVSVNVTADQPGDKYNVGLKDFTIPGFKGTDNYTILYARSKTPLAGGYIGNVPDINQADLTKAVTDLKSQIAADVDKGVVSKVKTENAGLNDYIYIPGGLVVDYADPDVQQSADGKSAAVTETAKATAMAISNSSLSAFLAQDSDIAQESDNATDTADVKKGNGSYTGDFSKVTIEIPSNVTAKALALSANQTNPGITATASGTASIMSGVDTVAITSAVSHLSRQQAIDIIKNMVDFNMIQVSIKPWWMSKLPDSSKIRVNIQD